MKIRAIPFVFVLALHGGANAQNSLDLCQQKFVDGYHAGVNKRIDAAVARKPSLLLTTFPSFERESAIRVAGSDIYFVEFQNQFWDEAYVVDRKGVGHMDFSKPKGAVIIHHAPLDAAITDRIVRLYTKAIADATRSHRMGLDGTTYLFSTPDGACGWAWSPEPETRNGWLIELMKRLESHAKFSAPIDLQRSEKAIVRYLNAADGTKH